MKRFFERVRQKALNVSQPPLLIAALGDSVTQGVTEHQLLDASIVYHRKLQEMLETFFPTTTFSTINAGVSGSNAPQGLGRLTRDVISHRPDLVLVAFGLNDSLGGLAGIGKFSSAIREIVSRVKSETEADVIVVTPPFMATKRSHRIHPDHNTAAEIIIAAQNDGMLAAYAGELRKIAEEFSVPVADVQAEWKRLADTGVDTDLWLINGLNHPDARGHYLAATTIFQTILRLRELA